MDSVEIADSADPASTGDASFQTTGFALEFARLGLPDASELANLGERRRVQDKNGQPLEIGYARDLTKAAVDMSGLTWQRLADGSQGAQLSLSSPSAAAVRVALDFSLGLNKRMQPDLSLLTLRFRGNDGKTFQVAGKSLLREELNWSPVVQGDSLTMEIVVAAGTDPALFDFRIPQLSHMDVDPSAADSAITRAVGDSDYCERDIVCRSSPPSAFRSTAKAVARMVFTKGGSSYLCSGTLLNNSHSPRKHLFWTANHCISTQTVANSLQTYWFYEVTTCNGSTVSSAARTLTGGAYLRHNNSARDTALLELKTTPPSGAIYAGWNSAAIGAVNTAIEGIHHPAGDVKKYSLGKVTQLSGSIDGKGPFYRVQWNTGVTEGGSSGSGLFTVSSTGSYQLRGGLYGGLSYCTAPTDPDYYSRFADVYSSISSYLSP